MATDCFGVARAALAWALQVSSASAVAAAPGLDFDGAFSDVGAPPQAHFVARYRTADGDHRLEAWRQGEERVKRRTDDTIETVLQRAPGDAEWRLTVLDLKRRIRTDVDRSNLYRMGHFADWFGMAHALARPRGAYLLAPLGEAERPRPAAIAACRWYRLARGERLTQVSEICWSEAMRLPLVITDGAGELRWRVESADTSPLAAEAFVVDDSGFVRNDANADIQAD